MLRFLFNIAGAIFVIAGVLMWLLIGIRYSSGLWQFISFMSILFGMGMQMYDYIKSGKNPLKDEHPEPPAFRFTIITALIVFVWALLLVFYLEGSLGLHFIGFKELFPF